MFKAQEWGPTTHINSFAKLPRWGPTKLLGVSPKGPLLSHKDNNGTTYGDGVGPIPKGH